MHSIQVKGETEKRDGVKRAKASKNKLKEKNELKKKRVKDGKDGVNNERGGKITKKRVIKVGGRMVRCKYG